MRRTKTRRAAALLAFLLALAVLTPTLTLPVEAVKQSDIDALKEDANDLASQRKKLQERINALKSDKSKAIQQKELLDEQVDNTQAEINNVQRQIDTYTALIAQTEDELAEAERQEEAQYELFCARVRAMEERGDISYWAVLFRAESFTDMLSRLDAINELMDSDQAVIDRLQALQEEIKTKQADLEEQKAGVESAKAELLQKKSELEDQRAEAIALVKEIDDNQAEYQATVDQIKALFGSKVYGVDVPSMEAVVEDLLRQRGLTLGTAESCTGGLMAKRLTDVPGASHVFKGGVVSYTNEVKHNVLGVPQDMLDQFGAVSAPVAAAMAQGARQALGCDVALSSTGVAGPDRDDRGNEVGTMFVAIATAEGTHVKELHLGARPVRARLRTQTASHAFDLARRYLSGLPYENA